MAKFGGWGRYFTGRLEFVNHVLTVCRCYKSEAKLRWLLEYFFGGKSSNGRFVIILGILHKKLALLKTFFYFCPH
jgi:hypothetical protein